jgi:Tol biopolymer transport system component
VRPRAKLLAACAAAGVLLLPGCGDAGDPRPDVVFVSTRDGDYALYAMNADGGRQQRLSSEEADTSSTGAIYFQVEPSFAPDGRRLAYAGRRAGNFDIYVTDVDGTDVRRLTTTGADERAPSFSPDGERLVFARVEPGDLFIASADGSSARRVSRDGAEETEPAWSPDGRWIAYVRRTPGTDAREIWVVRPDGSGRRRLTSLGAASYTPSWSPDGERIAFTSDARDGRFEIYSIGLDGSGLRRITRSDDDTFDPAWSLDGGSIAFSRGGAIVLADLAGGEERLTDGDNNDSSPDWNPRPPLADGESG